jgi:hypothetical protein
MRGRIAAVTTVALLGLSAGTTAYLVSRHPAKPALTTGALAAYQDAVLPSLREGGRIVQQEMKATVGDIESASGPEAARLASTTRNWESALAAVRAHVAAVPAPEALREASLGFDDALGRYIDAARQFGAAASTPLPARPPIMAKAYETARDADMVYDRASAVIQRWRHRFGLPSSPDFPDPDERT